MNILTKDFIAIDTNVAEHLFNPKKNVNQHISNLIERLRRDEIRLLIDSSDDPRKGSRIVEEYHKRLFPRVKKRQERYREWKLLRYFLLPGNYKVVKIDQKEPLMRLIKDIIGVRREKPVTDCFFVYVAFKKDRVLVTNDRGDILNNRKELKRRARKIQKRGLKGADILSSQEAYKRIADSNSAGGEPNHE